jgi:peptidoglycan/LPS O-acetylase OafA/YrhL
MSPTGVRSSTEEKFAGQDESLDLEAMIRNDDGLKSKSTSENTPSRLPLSQLEAPSLIQKFLCYPPPGSLEIKSTSWLDGVRGVAALGVYLFHAMGCWANIVSAWHADENQNNILQLPILRTFFVSGGAAVSVFFALSGYVLTFRSLRWIREGSKHRIYPAVASSMFRRGFRLYLPPVLLTFCEMAATRFGYAPPLNFTFVPEASFSAQFVDWLGETNRLVNPVLNIQRALQGFVTHPKYDAVIWTIPIEFYGSFVCYILLLTLVRIPSNGMRMGLVAAFSVSSMVMGSWNIFCFSAGMLIADINLGQDENATTPSPRPSKYPLIWSTVFAIAFYVAGFPTLVYPEAKLNPMPGFETLRSLIPMSLNMEDHSRFWWSLSGVSLLLSISQLPRLKSLFETNFCQYLGKISFSLYLVHEFCAVLFGLSLQQLMLRLAGLEPKAGTFFYWVVCAIWCLLFTVPVFAVAAQVEKWVDVPSVKFARWLERKCLKIYKNMH